MYYSKIHIDSGNKKSSVKTATICIWKHWQVRVHFLTLIYTVLTRPDPIRQIPAKSWPDPQERHLNFFLGGQNFFKFFSVSPDYWKLEKQHFICSNLTIYTVPFFLSFFFSFFFLSFFLFFFSHLKWRPCRPDPRTTPVYSLLLLCILH